MMCRIARSIALGSAVVILSGCEFLAKKPTTEEPVVIEPPVQEPVIVEPQVEEPPIQACEPIIIEKEKEVSCPKPVVCPKIVSNEVTNAGEFAIIGRIEYVDVMSISMRKKARIDTGAETTSIDASDIVEFERDGKKWVQFTVTDRSTDVISEIKAPVVRNVRIKQHGVDNVRRQVVELELRMGSLRERVEVTLADREKFDYPILIGRNFLRGRAVVDVSRKYLTLDKSNDSETNPIPSEPETPEPVAASQ